MPILRPFHRVTFIGMALAMFIAAPVAAQEITASHMEAALDALHSAGAARGFDSVLPAVSDRTKNMLIRMRPDLHSQISDTVDTVALALVARRTDLDNDVARIWAKNFTEEELTAVAEFFKSPAGVKYADTGPDVISESLQVVQGWSERLAEEMLEKSREELKQQGVEF